MTERLVVPLKPGNAGEGKGPQFRIDAKRSEGAEIGQPSNSGNCSETDQWRQCGQSTSIAFKVFAMRPEKVIEKGEMLDMRFCEPP